MSSNAAVWLAVAVVLAALEAGTTQFVSIWFSAAAAAATVAALFGAPLWLQILIFVAASAILVVLTRPLARRITRPGKIRPAQTPTNADRAIGETAIVTRDIVGGCAGQVKVNGLDWSAVSTESAAILAGERARVLAIEGAKLIVEKESLLEVT
ncbi:MAG: NfeD family protein [Oscillospiraceae bacterium]|jgi:membrane protein implicated in regulation of membrane protease activity|nr:NfeD family protein [Oscillospiraceae bacterium]